LAIFLQDDTFSNAFSDATKDYRVGGSASSEKKSPWTTF